MKVGDKWEVNPDAENLHNLKDGYYERGLQGKGEDWIKVNLANEYGFVVDGKPVHPDYADSVHCWPEVLKPTPGEAHVRVTPEDAPDLAVEFRRDGEIEFREGVMRIAHDGTKHATTMAVSAWILAICVYRCWAGLARE